MVRSTTRRQEKRRRAIGATSWVSSGTTGAPTRVSLAVSDCTRWLLDKVPQRLETERIRAPAEATDDPARDFRGHGPPAPLVPGVDVGEVHLDHRDRQRRERIPQREPIV